MDDVFSRSFFKKIFMDSGKYLKLRGSPCTGRNKLG